MPKKKKKKKRKKLEQRHYTPNQDKKPFLPVQHHLRKFSRNKISLLRDQIKSRNKITLLRDQIK